jgi:hypothetical protein
MASFSHPTLVIIVRSITMPRNAFLLSEDNIYAIQEERIDGWYTQAYL